VTFAEYQSRAAAPHDCYLCLGPTNGWLSIGAPICADCAGMYKIIPLNKKPARKLVEGVDYVVGVDLGQEDITKDENGIFNINPETYALWTGSKP
jgi:hypothetical protein